MEQTGPEQHGNDRKILDRRHLEEAHLKVCLLEVFQRYPEAFKIQSFSPTFNDNLDKYTPLYYEAFLKQYAGWLT